jgi:hypothetical protein
LTSLTSLAGPKVELALERCATQTSALPCAPLSVRSEAK